MSLEEFEEKFVVIPGGSQRAGIFESLVSFIAQIQEHGISGELWLDGSFLTEKPNPDDLDGSLMIHTDVFDDLSEDARNFLEDFNFEASQNKSVLDLFPVIEYPCGHPNEHLDPIDGWVRQWSTQHDERWLKGFAILRIGNQQC